MKRKLDVIAETARAMTDIIDADRAHRLEILVVVLITADEILLTIDQIVLWRQRSRNGYVRAVITNDRLLKKRTHIELLFWNLLLSH